MTRRFAVALVVLLAPFAVSRQTSAQQRPLVTEDPEPVGAGRVLLEGGVEVAHDQHYPASGLQGNLLRVATLGVSVGISSIAELHIGGGLYDRLNITGRDPLAPLASALGVTGDSTNDVSDIVIATKIRMVAETAGRPALGIRFATKLPNASTEKGLGLGTTDFHVTLVGAKTAQSIRVVGNIGVGILADPTAGDRQNDVIDYGFSFARAMTQETEVVGELNGRASTRKGTAFPGTESRGILKVGGRYTRGPVRLDAGVFVGLTTNDPTVGVTTGFTYVFNAFTIP